MRPSDNWRSVFLLSQSAKKRKNKNAKDSPSPPPQKISFSQQARIPKTQPQAQAHTQAQTQTEIPRRHTMSGPTPRSMLDIHTPDSDVSPKTTVQPRDEVDSDYFVAQSQREEKEADNKDGEPEQLSRATTVSSFASPSLESAPGSLSAETAATETYAGRDRGSSISSLTFAPTRHASLPQGTQKRTDRERIRASSPPPERFKSHVAFDNLPLGEATKNNTTSLTLNVRHNGYQAQRRSRTFMVGVDEHTYSDYALQWLLDELVDDGDEIVCVRVIEKELRTNDAKHYQNDANSLMQRILDRNDANRAISVVLEYACGKLHGTFQHLIQMYQPAMLIVGTRGRSLGGLQGLVNTRNSFSKYCLQYSPVPVVVVRPTEKREKKKSKRRNDSERQTYVRMLSATGGKHEADSERSSMYEYEIRNSSAEEAHEVARALGLPASFDPTIKPIDPNSLLHPRGNSLYQTSTASSSSKAPASTAGDSDDDDDDEDEFEVVSGQQLIHNQREQKDKLHKMEVGEAAALLQQNRKASLDSSGNADDDDDDDNKVSRTSSTS